MATPSQNNFRFLSSSARAVPVSINSNSFSKIAFSSVRSFGESSGTIRIPFLYSFSLMALFTHNLASHTELNVTSNGLFLASLN